MRHPRCIAERRHNRVTVMARRRKVILRWFPPHDNYKPENTSAWRRCGKWNLACGCYLCSRQDSSFRRQRRRQFKRDIAENISEWSDLWVET